MPVEAQTADLAKLLPELQAGEDGAWRLFFAEFDPLIRSVVAWTKWGFSEDVQADSAQEIRAALTRSIRTYRADASLATFVKRVAVNRCIDQVRRQVRERAHVEPLTFVDGDDEVVERDVPAGPSFDPVREILVEERARALRGVLARLDETCAKAIGLFYMDGVAYKDMAEMLSISINTVGARLSKCLDKLRGMALNDAQLGDEPAG